MPQKTPSRFGFVQKAIQLGRLVLPLAAVVLIGLSSYQFGEAQSDNLLPLAIGNKRLLAVVGPIFMILRLAPVLGAVAVLAYLLRSRLFFLTGLHGLFVGPIIDFLTDYLPIFKMKMRVTWARSAVPHLSRADAVSFAFQGIAIVACLVVLWRWRNGQFRREYVSASQYDSNTFVSANLAVVAMWLSASVFHGLGFFVWVVAMVVWLLRPNWIDETGRQRNRFSIQHLMLLTTLIAVLLAYLGKFVSFWNFWVHL